MTDKSFGRCEEYRTNTGNISRVRASMPEEDDLLRLAEVFRILGDPTRIRMLYALSQCEMCVCDIAETLEMTQSAISHQLKLLRDLKLVKFRKEGKSVIYSLDDDHILQLFRQGMEHVLHS